MLQQQWGSDIDIYPVRHCSRELSSSLSNHSASFPWAKVFCVEILHHIKKVRANLEEFVSIDGTRNFPLCKCKHASDFEDFEALRLKNNSSKLRSHILLYFFV